MMEIQEMITLALNSGMAIVVTAYFMFRDYQFMGSLQITLNTLVNTVDALKELVERPFPYGNVKENDNGITSR